MCATGGLCVCARVVVTMDRDAVWRLVSLIHMHPSSVVAHPRTTTAPASNASGRRPVLYHGTIDCEWSSAFYHPFAFCAVVGDPETTLVYGMFHAFVYESIRSDADDSATLQDSPAYRWWHGTDMPDTKETRERRELYTVMHRSAQEWRYTRAAFGAWAQHMGMHTGEVRWGGRCARDLWGLHAAIGAVGGKESLGCDTYRYYDFGQSAREQLSTQPAYAATVAKYTPPAPPHNIVHHPVYDAVNEWYAYCAHYNAMRELGVCVNQ